MKIEIEITEAELRAYGDAQLKNLQCRQSWNAGTVDRVMALVEKMGQHFYGLKKDS